ncbi:predicted protein, partial [Phaeodactylum tricornutum CCAP 1055/1]
AFPLGLCEGDCDRDSDCQGNLRCFQRGASRESVPGCTGADADATRFDYCYDPLTPTPASAPPSVCEGDCDQDSDCAGDLRCFQRSNGHLVVPGCAGGAADVSHFDYCYDPTYGPTLVSVQLALSTVSSARADPSLSSLGSEVSSGLPDENRSDRRLQSVAVVGDNGSPSSRFPLGLCQGDCDRDSDCAGTLRCFQRNGGQDVPGCAGGAKDRSKSDYCYNPNASVRPPPAPVATRPIPAPVPSPASVAVVGNNGSPSSRFPLGLCQGDCDRDSDCAGTLRCFQRNGGQDVPGCSGGSNEGSRSDFCYDPAPEASKPVPVPTRPNPAPVPPPPAGPVVSPVPAPVAAPSPSGPRPVVTVVGDNGSPSSRFPLGLCQGDCDRDSDCAGTLRCFQRNGGQDVPGCSGGSNEGSRSDFC